MKEFVKVSADREKLSHKELFLAISVHFLMAVVGFVATKGVVMDKLLPFGLSVIAGCSLTYTPACAIGVFVGYFIPAVGNGAFKYLAALFAILSIKLLLSNYKRLVNSEVFLTFITFLASFLTSGAALKIQGGSVIDVISESVIATVGTYFVRRSFRIFSRDNAGLSPDELVSVLIVINILLLGFNNVELYLLWF